MKKLIKISKALFIGLLTLAVVLIVGLLVYYHSIYKETPQPPEVSIQLNFEKDTLASDKPVLFPIPKNVEWTSGYFNVPVALSFQSPAEDAQAIKKVLKNRLNIDGEVKASGVLKFMKNPTLKDQSYTLSIQPSQIKIEYNDFQGLFFALTTVKQLAKQTNNQLPCVQIEDSPDLKIRGAMLDISRGKVPTLETLYGLVDFLSDVKYNHLELYIEGFSFAYPSFKHLWEKTETPITPDEIKQLDMYCQERFIELVPNQNSLGHMNAWLATEDFKDLAECPDGYKFLGLIDMKSTLSPTNPESLELVKKMSDDLLPNFSSNKFNVNLDEPFELGKNKDRPIEDPKEVARIYLDYAERLNTFVKSKGKQMWMWGDIISRNPEFAAEIPKDITLLEWRYESLQDFEGICKKYKEAGLNYMVCPGTSSWTSFTGRTDNMMGNIENAVSNGIKYDADGMLITDWGDTPHLQYVTVSYAGLAYGGALSWNNDAKSKADLGKYLSKIVFKDTSIKMGEIVLELGRYNQFEEYPMLAGTMTGWAFRFGMIDKTMTDAIYKRVQKGIFELVPVEDASGKALTEIFNNPKIYNSKAIIDLVDALEKELSQIQLSSKAGALTIDEYKNAIRMVKLGAKLKQFNNYHLQQSDEENKQILLDMKSLCTTILPEHERLWMIRNKRSGYEQSTELIKNLQVQIDKNLELLDKNAISRWYLGNVEKIKTAIAVLYLK